MLELVNRDGVWRLRREGWESAPFANREEAMDAVQDKYDEPVKVVHERSAKTKVLFKGDE